MSDHLTVSEIAAINRRWANLNPLPASVTPDARHLGAGPKNPAPLSTPVSSHTAQHGEVSV